MLDSKNKLIPLRRFVVIDGYSKEYLSQLVQRKRLKAQKVGRNYFTTLEWFEDYLDKFSRDDKSVEIKKNLYQAIGYLEPDNKLTHDNAVSFLLPEKSEFKSLLSNKFAIIKYILTATLVVAVFMFLFSLYSGSQTDVADNSRFGELTAGRVAGASESKSLSNNGPSTSSGQGEL